MLSHYETVQHIHAVISIKLDYCNPMLYNTTSSSISRLKHASRILTRPSYITEVRIDLLWLIIVECIVYKN